jgi:hypothetical protein
MNVGSFLADHWGDLASVAGLVAATWAAFKAKAAADAAQEVKRRIAHLDALAELSAALATLDIIKRLHRGSAWVQVLDQYDLVRRHLVRVESMQPDSAYGQEIRKAIRQFSMMETKVGQAMEGGGQVDYVALNGTVSDQVDVLERIIIAIKQSGA